MRKPKKASRPPLSLFSRQCALLLWGVGLLWLAAVILYPVSIGLTRTAGAVLAGMLAAGGLALAWRYRWLRWTLLLVYGIAAAFFALPGRSEYDRVALRQEIVRSLQRYEGVRYMLGGENFLGIDCSGLIRRGTLDGTFLYGLRTLNPLLARKAVVFWWHDKSAREMGMGAGKTARKVIDEKSLLILNDKNLHPGDFAITSNGIHALAYLGDHLWLEADPGEGKVIRVNTATPRNPWMNVPVSVLRWRFLEVPFRKSIVQGKRIKIICTTEDTKDTEQRQKFF
jgi:hypothetical protein